MSSLTELPKDASELADAFRESGDGEWRELLGVASRMGYQTPEPAGILPNMTGRLVGAGHPPIAFTLDSTGDRIANAVVMP